MNVLVISCHPDDMEINCAGTLIKCVKRGDKVTVCHIANGDMGHVVIQPEELRKIRIEEAKRSGALAGIEVVTLDVGDLRPNGSDMEQRDKLANLIKKVKPDFIITHAPNDYMPDHVEVSKLAFNASFVATVPHYGAEGAANNVPIYYMENAGGVDFVPTEYVDITEEMELKIEMAACHESQVVWLKDHDDMDYLEIVRVISRLRGHQCGVKYAEGFRQELSWGKIVPRRLLP